MLLIYDDEQVVSTWGEKEFEELLVGHNSVSAQMTEAGVMDNGGALQPTETATTVRKDATGKMITTDGPFAETKEQFGGFYIVNCDDLDEAISWANKIPTSGSVEVRPMMEFD
ncbi:MAG: YciI family protein [Chloroflexota bacterium]